MEKNAVAAQAMEDAQYIVLIAVHANLLLVSHAATAAEHFTFEQN